MLYHTCNILTYCDVVAPGYGKDVVYSLNTTDKTFITIFLTTVQLLAEANNDPQIVIHTAMKYTDISVARLLKNIF